jgi:SAM-dependent methyltransferase
MPRGGPDPILDPGARSPERLRVHYELERKLADRLRKASREERTSLYGEVYDELFRSIPDHPQHTNQIDAAQSMRGVEHQVAIIADLLDERGGRVLEIGAGDCAVSLALAPRVDRVYAVEVSETIAAGEGTPENFELLITDGRAMPVPEGTIDVAYSNQLMEHLHPDDAVEQVTNVFRALAPGGAYICLTPNRLLGPADISAFFDDVATGFHLREYSTSELVELFKGAGFADVQVLALGAGRRLHLPAWPFVLVERIAARLPRRVRHQRIVRKLIDPGGGVIARKA